MRAIVAFGANLMKIAGAESAAARLGAPSRLGQPIPTRPKALSLLYPLADKGMQEMPFRQGEMAGRGLGGGLLMESRLMSAGIQPSGSQLP
jgi:hypothetical protein